MMKQDEPGTFLFKQIHDALERNINNSLRKMGLTLSQGAVLWNLGSASAGQMSLKELERALRVAQSTTARIVQNMERNGIVESFGDAADKRIKYIRLTKKGEAFAEFCRQNREEFDASVFSGFSEEEKRQFLSMLERIKQNIMK